MRRIFAIAGTLVAAGLLVASGTVAVSGAARHVHGTPTLAACATIIKKLTITPGKITVATDSPVLSPWFKNNQPTNQRGYESALTYRIAHALGVATKSVKWVTEPFASSYAPGPKNFDFDINEVVATPARALDVTFSSSYYNLTQSIVAMKSDAIVKQHSRAQLKKYHYGFLINTPAESYVEKYVRPITVLQHFDSVSAMVTALESGAIDAIVIDTPTGKYLADTLIIGADSHPLATQVGQFAAVGDEYYALVVAKKNPLVACLNVTISSLKSSGVLRHLSTNWLSVYNSVPLIKP